MFIHFTIRAAEAAIRAKKRLGAVVRFLIEHPQDLGSTRNGVPASIWHLAQIRRLQDLNPDMVSVAGHQCQLKVDYSKPTRLYSDIPKIADFGKVGWP